MKNLLIVVFLLMATTCFASQKAITDTGEEVILHNNGTWEYSANDKKLTDEIKTNDKIFNKPKDSTFLLKSTRNNSAYWINTDKWVFSKATDNPEAEYQFQLKGKDLYGMTITEEAQIPLETLAHLALNNALSKVPDAHISKQEYRIVNGNNLIYLEIIGTFQGIKFNYLGYYYSDSSGCTQLITYTTTNLVDKYRSEINDFLNGLIVR